MPAHTQLLGHPCGDLVDPRLLAGTEQHLGVREHFVEIGLHLVGLVHDDDVAAPPGGLEVAHPTVGQRGRHPGVHQAPRGGDPDVGLREPPRRLMPLAPVPQRAPPIRFVPPLARGVVRVVLDEVLAGGLVNLQRARTTRTERVERARGAHELEPEGVVGYQPSGPWGLETVQPLGVSRAVPTDGRGSGHTRVPGELVGGAEHGAVVAQHDRDRVALLRGPHGQHRHQGGLADADQAHQVQHAVERQGVGVGERVVDRAQLQGHLAQPILPPVSAAVRVVRIVHVARRLQELVPRHLHRASGPRREIMELTGRNGRQVLRDRDAGAAGGRGHPVGAGFGDPLRCRVEGQRRGEHLLVHRPALRCDPASAPVRDTRGVDVEAAHVLGNREVVLHGGVPAERPVPAPQQRPGVREPDGRIPADVVDRLPHRAVTVQQGRNAANRLALGNGLQQVEAQLDLHQRVGRWLVVDRRILARQQRGEPPPHCVVASHDDPRTRFSTFCRNARSDRACTGPPRPSAGQPRRSRSMYRCT